MIAIRQAAGCRDEESSTKQARHMCCSHKFYMQAHESKAEEYRAFSLELGHLMVEMQEPEQAIPHFTPTSPELEKDMKFKLLAAVGQLRYHQWYIAWGETLATLSQDKSISPSRSAFLRPVSWIVDCYK